MAVALERLSVAADQELLKVPGDVGAGHGTPDDVLGVRHEVIVGDGQQLPEEGEKRVCVLAVNVGLLEEGDFGLKAQSRTDVLQGI